MLLLLLLIIIIIIRMILISITIPNKCIIYLGPRTIARSLAEVTAMKEAEKHILMNIIITPY